MKQTANYQILYDLLKRYKRPSDELMQILYPLITAKSYDAKDIFTHSGELQQRIALLIEGGALGYSKVGKQTRLLDLWTEHELILNPESTVCWQKSNMEILFPRPSKTLEISTRALFQLRDQHPEITLYFDGFLVGEIRRLQEHMERLRNDTAQQRIHGFRERYRTLTNYIAVGHKAQFLNMSTRWYQKIVNQR